MIKERYIVLVFISLFFLIVLLINLIPKDNNLSIGVNKDIGNKINYNDVINRLKEEYNNEDIIGILELSNTDFLVPIVQGSDNKYYLTHTLTREQSNIGAVFLDYRINIDISKKSLIYGHSSSKVDAPFNVLENYYDLEYYKNHKYIEVTTDTEEKIYEIFSVYIETGDFSYMDLEFIDKADFLRHVEKLQTKSIHGSEIQLKEDDQILILQTCSHHKDYLDYEKKYLLIVSRRIK